MAKVRLIMAKRASMEQDMRLRTANLYYRIAEKKCQEEGIEPEAYEPGQTDEEATSRSSKTSLTLARGIENMLLSMINSLRQH